MMARLLAPLVQVVFPHQCRLCLELIVPEDVFCAACLRKVQPIVSAYLPVTKTIHLPVIGLSAYTDPLRQLVLKKFNGDRLASEQLARLLLQLSPLATIPVDVVVPVPLHWTRYAWRGFNQAVEMARVIARGKGARVCSCVMRKRKTSFQSRLKAAERQNNVRGAFGIHPWYRLRGMDGIRGKHVLIVDDLCTTGATLVQVAKILLPHKPASITAVVACRAV